MWILWTGVASATTWTVGNTKDFPTLAAAVAGAVSGDVLLVDPGRWIEAVDPAGKDLQIRSVGGPGVTTLAPPTGITAVRFEGGEDGLLEGFTVEGTDARCVEVVGGAPTLRDLVLVGCGASGIDGGAIRIDGGGTTLEEIEISSPTGGRGGALWVGNGAVITVTDLDVDDAQATWGGSLYATDALLILDDVFLQGSSADLSGGAMYLDAADVSVVALEIVDATAATGGGVSLEGGSSLVVDGGAITGGETSITGPGNDGGAVYLDATSSLDLRDVTLADNHAHTGGGVATVGGQVDFDGVTIEGNTAQDAGGGIHAVSAIVACTSCLFVDNTAAAGGGVALRSDARLVDVQSSFIGNTASADGGAIDADGAFLVSLTDSVIQGNEAADAGGAIHGISVTGGLTLVGVRLDSNLAVGGDGGAIWAGSSTPVTLTDAVLDRNRAAGGTGGALAVDPVVGAEAVVITNSVIQANSADRSGGAIFVDGVAAFTIADSQLLRNVAGDDGGGIRITDAEVVDLQRVGFHDNVASGNGGGVAEEDTVVRSAYRSCSFTENAATLGGGLALASGIPSEVINDSFAGNRASVDGAHLHLVGGSPRLINTVFALGLDGGGVWGDATAAAGADRFFTLVWQNAGGDWGGSFGPPPDSSGNLEADPGFRSLTLDGDELDDDLRLDIGSVAIDAGDPSLFDVDGTRSDIGAWGGPLGFRIDADGDGSYAHADCDETDPSTYPGAVEVPYDHVDQDCDGSDPRDLDGDGFDGGPGDPDCDDTDPDVHPDAVEVYYDGVDADCSGDGDLDADGDGYDVVAFGGTDCDDTDPTIHPGAVEVFYDGRDGDCSGTSDYDQDGDGRDAPSGGGQDCDDLEPTVFPGAIEACDRRDNDCNDLVDDFAADAVPLWIDADADGYGDPAAWTTGCFADAGLADNDGDCDDGDPAVHPGATEVWYDGIDDDCDGRDDDQDMDGFAWIEDCDDLDVDVFPGAPEVENGRDDDCDGFAEDDDRDGDGLVDWDEWAIGTDPTEPDTDGDGIEDGSEVPDPMAPPDTDDDGDIDPLDTDDDGDFLSTALEWGIDPDGDGTPDRDVDGDGVPNHLDANTDGDGWPDLDEGEQDLDRDGVPDFADFQGPLVGGGCSEGTAVLFGLWGLPLMLRRRRHP